MNIKVINAGNCMMCGREIVINKDNYELPNIFFCPRCERKILKETIDRQKTRDEKTIDAIDFAIKATDTQDDYSMGMRNGMRYVKSLIDGKEPQYEVRRTDEEKKLEIELGDEVVDNRGAKGVVVGITTHKGVIMLSLLMRNHKVPQFVNASMFETKTGRHFPQIIEILKQINEESEGEKSFISWWENLLQQDEFRITLTNTKESEDKKND